MTRFRFFRTVGITAALGCCLLLAAAPAAAGPSNVDTFDCTL